MIAILCSTDGFLQEKVGAICAKAGIRVLRTKQIERVIRELKQPHRVAVIDVTVPEVQERGVLRQLINVGRIMDNEVVCMCPNDDEELKKMARGARPAEVFLRYDLTTTFAEHLSTLAIEEKQQDAS